MGIEQRRREGEPEQTDARPDGDHPDSPEGPTTRETSDGGEGDVAADIRARGRGQEDAERGEHPLREGLLGALEVTAAVVEVAEVAKVVGPLL